ncbi:unnamed protein product [Echinostoma caproni]|uniref:PseudoU_synth_2 domain-containing protein n=1 Tax=Echinostoma caproni TaxID=27848 RepID=A0A183AH28_9TREM|nr:unnamed protein product [Echinostoma caproni]
MGLHAVIPETDGGKPARTHFIRLAYDAASDTSLVLCRLYTGRTHQIRVHLQFLGYPIVEDPLYNSTDWGDEKGKGARYGMPVEEQNSSASEQSARERFVTRVRARSSLSQADQDRLITSFDPTCPDCQLCYRDPEMSQLVLQLHAYRYAGSDWAYTAPLPDWATSVIPSTDLCERVEACISCLEME